MLVPFLPPAQNRKSHGTLERSKSILNVDNQKKIQTVGQNYDEANFIFFNNTSEVNKNYNKKYEIPKNFEKIDELRINRILVYEIFKKNN